jgi:hypothetical protein
VDILVSALGVGNLHHTCFSFAFFVRLGIATWQAQHTLALRPQQSSPAIADTKETALGTYVLG